MNRLPWGHRSRQCVYCWKVGPRTVVPGGWAHKRCIPRYSVDHPDNIRKVERASHANFSPFEIDPDDEP